MSFLFHYLMLLFYVSIQVAPFIKWLKEAEEQSSDDDDDDDEDDDDWSQWRSKSYVYIALK